RHPDLAADKAKMHKRANEYLIKTTGLTKEQITREWQNGRWRSAPEQMIIADAIAHEAARESMRELPSKRAPVWPVQRPGNFQPARGAGDLDQVRALERQLEGATGQQALKLAKALTQARRAAGLLQAEG